MTNSIPALPVYNIKVAVDFYKSRFGFSIPYQDEGFAKLLRDEVEIHLWAASDESWKTRINISSEPIISGAESFLPGTASCRIEVQSIDELFDECKKQGILYNSITIIQEQPWSIREFPTLDLHGNLITFFERMKAGTH